MTRACKTYAPGWQLRNVTGVVAMHVKLLINFTFISCNIPTSPAYEVHISQLMHYSRACTQYSDFLDRSLLLKQKQLKQDYVAHRLKSSLQKEFCDHHDLVDHYEILISQMVVLFTYISFLSIIY